MRDSRVVGAPVAQPLLWRWINAWLALGVVVTTAALAGVPGLLRDAGDRVFAPFAATLYALGAVTMVASMAFRVTVQAAAAAQTSLSGQVPASYEPLHLWAGSLFAWRRAPPAAPFRGRLQDDAAAANLAPGQDWRS